MRTLEEIPHPLMRISIFSMNQKFIIKFERGNFEQSYKVSEMDIMDISTVKLMLNDVFLENILQRFNQMREEFNALVVQHS